MTVEQSPLPVRPAQRTREDSLTLAKIKEVTGAPDDVIEEAIRACLRTDGTLKIEDVVTTIIGDDIAHGATKSKTHVRQTNTKPQDHVDAMSSTSTEGQKKQPAPGKLSSAPDEYIDLTRDAQGILGGQISREEQDISRVLEASLAESKGTTKRKRGELWFIDPLNPYERKRLDGWPVGLKNVGNTCWFSAVIQSLFHIRKFRDIVLHYKHRSTTDNELARNLRFVMELQQLFALMVGSHRKYVDPSKSVDILKEASASTVLDGQQDVSEFQHKLLDWLEDAFRDPTSPSSENPVHKLFQGKYLAEGIHEGKVFSQEVTFGQYPLNVVGFRDIHESLEATTAQGEIETINGDSSQKSGQEIWFKDLPLVLTFELSRFGFNQQLNRAEKIHQELTFPPVIYVDRYLECNKVLTKQKREEARKLKDELTSLQARLDKFMNYGSSNKRYPLPDVLQYALEFAESSPVTPQQTADVEMESPLPFPRTSQDVQMTPVSHYASTSEIDQSTPSTPEHNPSCHMTSYCNLSQKDRGIQTKTTSSSLSSSPVPEAKKFKDSSVQVEFDATLMPSSVVLTQSCPSQSAFLPMGQTFVHTPVAGCSGDFHPSCSQTDPHPRTVSTDELRVLHNCLKRWREEVETDVRELQKNINVLEKKLDKMYSADSMKKFPYHLHAVLVHEGQAVSGHYWSFIFDERRDKWLKFNDITVSESSFEEMRKESVGGFHNASAYCLMYIDKARLEEGQEELSPTAVSQHDLLASLPADLRGIVEEDNAAFQQELHAWDEEQRRKTLAATSSTVSSSVTTVTASTMTPASSSSVVSPSQWRNTEGPSRPRSGSDDQDVVVTGEQRPGEAVIIKPMNSAFARLADQHAQLSVPQTLEATSNMANSITNTQEVIKKAMEKELVRLKGLSTTLLKQLPSEDPRLGHIVLYLLCSHADELSVQIILSEQFALCALMDTLRIKGLRQHAHEMYKALYNSAGKEGIKFYEFWHKRYHHFRQSIFMFSEAVDAYCSHRYQEALPYFCQAWLHNAEPYIASGMLSEEAKINSKMLSYFRRKSLQKLNHMTLKSFECEEDMTDALTIMMQQILPALSHISQSELKEDMAAVEEVREKWCQFLEKDLSAEKIERLQDFLSKMFDGNGTTVHFTLSSVRENNLGQMLSEKYVEVLRKLKVAGELNSWLEAS
ncbi:ubiquitin carboxyl-terminal hydrolase 25-like isoform X1 [Biomphalaria glabrata]